MTKEESNVILDVGDKFCVHRIIIHIYSVTKMAKIKNGNNRAKRHHFDNRSGQIE